MGPCHGLKNHKIDAQSVPTAVLLNFCSPVVYNIIFFGKNGYLMMSNKWTQNPVSTIYTMIKDWFYLTYQTRRTTGAAPSVSQLATNLKILQPLFVVCHSLVYTLIGEWVKNQLSISILFKIFCGTEIIATTTIIIINFGSDSVLLLLSVMHDE